MTYSQLTSSSATYNNASLQKWFTHPEGWGHSNGLPAEASLLFTRRLRGNTEVASVLCVAPVQAPGCLCPCPNSHLTFPASGSAAAATGRLLLQIFAQLGELVLTEYDMPVDICNASVRHLWGDGRQGNRATWNSKASSTYHYHHMILTGMS